MKKKLFSVFLVMLMAIVATTVLSTTLPDSAFAESSATSYAITNCTTEEDSTVNNGYITIDKTSAAKNETVTITVNPASHYELKSLTFTPVGFIDLGITDSDGKPLYWAESNLGASKAEDPGDYYVWGTTQLMYSAVDYTKQDGAFTFVTENPYGDSYINTWDASKGFEWNNVPFTNGIFNPTNNTNAFTKYTTSSEFASSGTPDNLTTLEPEDDAATAKDASLRIPVTDEYVALLANCVLVWTDDYNGSGMAGYIVYKAKNDDDKGKADLNGTWKIWDPTNSKYVTEGASEASGYTTASDVHIFLPAAGDGAITRLEGFGNKGGYLTATLYPSNDSKSNSLVFSNKIITATGANERRNAYSVRPVMDNPEITTTQLTYNTYTFSMPGYPVNITAEFEEVWNDWEEFDSGKGAWTHTALFDSPADCYVEVYCRTSKTDENIKQLKIGDWGKDLFTLEGMDLIVNWNTDTDEITIPSQEIGVESGYGEIAKIQDFKSKTGQDYPCTYDSSTGIFAFPVIYFISLGSFGSNYETLTMISDIQYGIYTSPGNSVYPATEPTTITLEEDINLNSSIIIPEGKNIILDLNGHVLNANGGSFYALHVDIGAQLTIADSNTAPDHAGYVDADGLWHFGIKSPLGENETAKSIKGGIITGCSQSCAVYNEGTFTMTGGTIAGNMANDTAGGVYNLYSISTFTMNGGSIILNKGAWGSGVLNTGVFIMNDGYIADNTSSKSGGGVYNQNTFTMTGGAITGNTASAGGGIMNFGTLNLTAAESKTITISGNKATEYGGGVLNGNEGSISGNLNISGKVIIKDNVCSEKYNDDTVNYSNNLETYKEIVITGALTDSEIYITFADPASHEHSAGVLTSGFTSQNKGAELGDFFTYDGPATYEMILKNGELEVILHVHNYTGEYIKYDETYNKWAKRCACGEYDTANSLTGVDAPTAESGLIYDSFEKTGVAEATGYKVTDGKKTAAGEYTAVVTLASGYIWSDGTIDNKQIEWGIAKAYYDMSNVMFDDASYTYDGEEKTIVISGTLPEGVSVSYLDNGLTDVGSVEVTATFTGDADNYEDIDSMTAILTVAKADNSWTTTPAISDVSYGTAVSPVGAAMFGDVRITYIGTGDTTYAISTIAPTDSGTYKATFSVDSTSNYGALTQDVNFTINRLAVNEPAVSGTYIYTGSEQSAVISGKEAYMTESGDIKGTDAGTYTIRYTIDGNHEWATGSDGTVTWSIDKAQNSIHNLTISNWKDTDNAITPTATADFGAENIVFTYYKGTTKLNAVPVTAGNYTVKAEVKGTNNYSDATAEKLFKIYQSSLTSAENEEAAKITASEKGIDPDAVLVVSVLPVENSEDINKVAKTLTDKRIKTKSGEIFGVYDVKLILDSTEIQPDGKITVQVLVPEEVRDKAFKLYHIHTDAETGEVTVTEVTYTSIDASGTLTFETDKLSQFVFVVDKASLWWVWVIIAVVVVIILVVLFFFIKKKKTPKNPDNTENTPEQAPVIATEEKSVEVTEEVEPEGVDETKETEKPETEQETQPDINIVEKVSVAEVNNLMSDDKAMIMSVRSKRIADKTRKTIVNIDTISEYFDNGEKVNIEELKKRIPSFDKKATYYKVCARGTLEKKLIVDADDFSVEAKKMILLTGGKVLVSISARK